jgi:hypothetical protein
MLTGHPDETFIECVQHVQEQVEAVNLTHDETSRRSLLAIHLSYHEIQAAQHGNDIAHLVSTK